MTIYVHTINKLTINKDDNTYIHRAPVLKVAQLYRKLIASLIGITAEGIIILPKMNLIVLIAVKSGWFDILCSEQQQNHSQSSR